MLQLNCGPPTWNFSVLPSMFSRMRGLKVSSGSGGHSRYSSMRTCTTGAMAETIRSLSLFRLARARAGHTSGTAQWGPAGKQGKRFCWLLHGSMHSVERHSTCQVACWKPLHRSSSEHFRHSFMRTCPTAEAQTDCRSISAEPKSPASKLPMVVTRCADLSGWPANEAHPPGRGRACAWCHLSSPWGPAPIPLHTHCLEDHGDT